MVEGELLRFVNKRYMGDVIYSNAYPLTRLGGLMPSRETIPLSLIHPKDAELDYALLEIGVLVPSTNIQWRVKVNGISVTKEFKPHIVSKAGENLFAKLVYDITSILRTPEGLRKKRVNVTFKHEGGEQIIVEHLAVLAFYKTEEAVTDITFLSGAVSLKPGEETAVNIPYTGAHGVLRSTVFIPSSNAQAFIEINGSKRIDIGGIQGPYEIIETIDNLKENNTILFRHEEAETMYYPKEMRLSNILILRTEYKMPKLEIKDIDVRDAEKGGKIIHVKLVNNGVSKPDSALIVLMSLGNVVARKIIEPIEPGQEVEEEIPVNLPKGEYDLVLRIIWRKLSKTLFNDKRVKLVF